MEQRLKIIMWGLVSTYVFLFMALLVLGFPSYGGTRNREKFAISLQLPELIFSLSLPTEKRKLEF